MNFNEFDVTEIQRAKQTLHDDIFRRFQQIRDLDAGRECEQWIRKNCVVTGGVVASILNREKVNDIDLYCSKPDFTAFCMAVQGLFVAKGSLFQHFVKDIDPKYMTSEEDGAEGKMITANAITLWNGMQIIRLAPIQESRDSFDFLHCRPWYDWNNLYISPQQYHSIISKRLVVNNPKNVARHRVDKFRQRGWNTQEVTPW